VSHPYCLPDAARRPHSPDGFLQRSLPDASHSPPVADTYSRPPVASRSPLADDTHLRPLLPDARRRHSPAHGTGCYKPEPEACIPQPACTAQVSACTPACIPAYSVHTACTQPEEADSKVWLPSSPEAAHKSACKAQASACSKVSAACTGCSQ